MIYYKKQKVRVVDKYKIIKLGCDICKQDILQGDMHFEITEYAKYPEDSTEYKHICNKCIKGYLEKFSLGKSYAENIEIQRQEYFESVTDDVDYGDIEIKE